MMNDLAIVTSDIVAAIREYLLRTRGADHTYEVFRTPGGWGDQTIYIMDTTVQVSSGGRTFQLRYADSERNFNVSTGQVTHVCLVDYGKSFDVDSPTLASDITSFITRECFEAYEYSYTQSNEVRVAAVERIEERFRQIGYSIETVTHQASTITAIYFKGPMAEGSVTVSCPACRIGDDPVLSVKTYLDMLVSLLQPSLEAKLFTIIRSEEELMQFLSSPLPLQEVPVSTKKMLSVEIGDRQCPSQNSVKP